MNHFNLPGLAALAGVAVLFGISTPAHAQAAASMPGMSMPMADQPASSSPSTAAYQAGSAAMMQGMDAPYTGNADQDFVAHMLPHHQGAVSMAQVELKYGRDPAMRKLAAAIIQAQDKEIALMKQWQARHPAAQ